MYELSIRSTGVDIDLAFTHHIQAIVTFCDIVWAGTFISGDSSYDIAISIKNLHQFVITIRHIELILNGLNVYSRAILTHSEQF